MVLRLRGDRELAAAVLFFSLDFPVVLEATGASSL
jgi:hypothetical protein